MYYTRSRYKNKRHWRCEKDYKESNVCFTLLTSTSIETHALEKEVSLISKTECCDARSFELLSLGI